MGFTLLPHLHLSVNRFCDIWARKIVFRIGEAWSFSPFRMFIWHAIVKSFAHKTKSEKNFIFFCLSTQIGLMFDDSIVFHVGLHASGNSNPVPFRSHHGRRQRWCRWVAENKCQKSCSLSSAMDRYKLLITIRMESLFRLVIHTP